MQIAEHRLVTAPTQKAWFRVPQSASWRRVIKIWFSASTFVVKIATFAKPETVTFIKK
jgi:hypothetical protein